MSKTCHLPVEARGDAISPLRTWVSFEYEAFPMFLNSEGPWFQGHFKPWNSRLNLHACEPSEIGKAERLQCIRFFGVSFCWIRFAKTYFQSHYRNSKQALFNTRLGRIDFTGINNLSTYGNC